MGDNSTGRAVFPLNYNDFSVIGRRGFLASCGLSLVPGCRSRRGSGFPGYAFVANEDGEAVAAVDLSAFALARHIPLQAAPTEVLANPILRTVYALTPETGVVHEIDPVKLSSRRRLQVSRRAVTMRLAPGGESLWVLAGEPRQLVRVSLKDWRLEGRIPLWAPPADLDLTADGSLGAVSHGAAGLVTLVDLADRRARKPVRAGDYTGTLRFRADGRQLLVADTARGVLGIVEVASGRLVTSLALAVKPEHFCFKPDGGELFVTGEGMDAVVIVNPYYTQVSETVLAGRAPAEMAISASPEYLFVANPPAGDVTILDVDSRRLVASVAVGEDPGFITMTPDHQYALILNRRSGNLAVIRLAAVVPRRTRGAPLFTTIPVGSRPVSAAVIAVS